MNYSSWFIILPLIAGCSAAYKKQDAPTIILSITHKSAFVLSKESLPASDVMPFKTSIDKSKIKQVEKIVSDFNKHGDELLSQVFTPFYGNKELSIPIVITEGVPAPYDAWTANFNGRGPAVFLNLSEWDASRIERVALPIIKHEVTHVLLKGILNEPSSSDLLQSLNYIVVNEGIAHFVGYARAREEILESKASECKAAEVGLALAFKKLKTKINVDEANEILKSANTGAFWKKFGAIGGMCRAAHVYFNSGAAGLTDAILKGHLPAPQS